MSEGTKTINSLGSSSLQDTEVISMVRVNKYIFGFPCFSIYNLSNCAEGIWKYPESVQASILGTVIILH